MLSVNEPALNFGVDDRGSKRRLTAQRAYFAAARRGFELDVEAQREPVGSGV